MPSYKKNFLYELIRKVDVTLSRKLCKSATVEKKRLSFPVRIFLKNKVLYMVLWWRYLFLRFSTNLFKLFNLRGWLFSERNKHNYLPDYMQELILICSVKLWIVIPTSSHHLTPILHIS